MAAKKRVGRIARMLGGAIQATCPPGVWCMDTTTVVFALLLLGILAYLAYQHCTPAKPTVVVVPSPAPPAISVSMPTMRQQADPRFSPLAPERSYDTPIDFANSPPLPPGIGAVPINVATRGVPEQFQQIGVLTAPGGSETSASPTRTILPLFGRKAATNRDRWNYYTRTDGMNPVQVPVEFQRRKCDDDNGCQEITDGDSVAVPILGQSYIANVYRYSTPRYLPGVL